MDTTNIWVLSAVAGAPFIALGLITVAVAACSLPRLAMLALFKLIYRVRKHADGTIPEEGGALIAANHQSYLDAFVISSLTRRPIRFLIDKDKFKKWYIRPFALLNRSIPVSNQQSARELLGAVREARSEIERGGLVGIFPEGRITRTGLLQPFQKGLLRIMKGLKEPIIPVAIDGAFSGKRTLNAAIGRPLSSGTTLRQTMQELMVRAFSLRKEEMVPLHRRALQSMRRHPLAGKLADASSKDLVSNARLLGTTVGLGFKLRHCWSEEETVGIALPPSLAAVCTNLAAALAGRVTVNVNYTLSPDIMARTLELGDVRLLITSQAFVQRAKLSLPSGCRVVFLEEIGKSLSRWDRIKALGMGLLAPVSMLEHALGRRKAAAADDVVTLLFSSGSTGIPKGVPLTHWNIGANIEGAWDLIRMRENSRILGILPFFHAFGYTANLWMPIVKNVGAAFCPNPVDAGMVGRIAGRYGVTHLLATPTMLTLYNRRVAPEKFRSLGFVLTGAEPLSRRVATSFEHRFGVKPIEGYGCTECAPVVTLSTRDIDDQLGAREGSIGQPIPGVAVRIRDLDNGKLLPPGEAGMLLVKGPNVMTGYHRLPEKTGEVLNNGWYVTGDVARVDAEGFVWITGRLSRFSKIGGEMVPHVHVEEALHEAAGREDTVFAVTGIPDIRRGERLVVLHTLAPEEALKAAQGLDQSGLPRLWLPKEGDFIKINEIPVLGTGKLDLKRLAALARENVPRPVNIFTR